MAGASLRGLARHLRDAASVDADRRQDQARARPDGQPLVAGRALCDRARAHHVADAVSATRTLADRFRFHRAPAEHRDAAMAAATASRSRRWRSPTSTPRRWGGCARSASRSHIWTMPQRDRGRHPVRAGSRRTRPTTPPPCSASGARWCRPIACSTRFRARLPRQGSPVHFFWGSFDLAVTRFSGRTAPPHPGGAPNVGRLGDARGLFARGVELRLLARQRRLRPRRVLLPTPIRSRRASPTRRCADGGRVTTPALERVHPALRRGARRRRPGRRRCCDFLQATYEAAADRAGWDRAGAGAQRSR